MEMGYVINEYYNKVNFFSPCFSNAFNFNANKEDLLHVTHWQLHHIIITL
jgi:hypothetical protein